MFSQESSQYSCLQLSCKIQVENEHFEKNAYTLNKEISTFQNIINII